MAMTKLALRADALRGRVALVTGVSRRRGIGYAIARRLLEAGAAVFVQSWGAYDVGQPWGGDDLSLLLEELRGLGPLAHAEVDFSQAAAPGQVTQLAVEHFGHVDILVANHAYSTMGDLAAVTAEQIDQHMAVNVRATLLLVQAFAV